MKNLNKKTIVSIFVVILFVISLVVLIFTKNNLQKVSQFSKTETVCPYIYAEDQNFKLTMNKCVQAYSETEKDYKLDGQYKVSEILIESQDGKIKKTYSVNRDFSVDSVPPRIQKDKNNSFLFLDEGTWTVRGLTIFSLKDNRFTDITYHNNLILIKNNYLVFETISDIFPFTHPEIDQSAATDVAVMSLSDFGLRYLEKGTENTDFHLKTYESNKEIINPNQIIKITDDSNIIIQKVVWKNPLKLDEGQTTTESTVLINSI